MKRYLTILILAVAGITSAQIPTNGLSAMYLFTDRSELDNSGNGNDGTLDGAPIPAFDRFGNSNNCMVFEPNNAYFTLPNSLLNQNELSISLWFNTNSSGVLIGQQSNPIDQPSTDFVPILYIKTNGELSGHLWDGTINNQAPVNMFVNTSQWYHVVITGDATGQNIYVNGNLVGSGSAPTPLASLVHNQIGSGRVDGSWPGTPTGATTFPFTGGIDDVLIYDRALTAAEVSAIYNAPNPDPIGDVAIYSFDQMNTLDESGSGNHAVPTNCTFTTDRFGNPDMALALDTATTAYLALPNKLLVMYNMSISMWFKTLSSGVLITQQNQPFGSSGVSDYVPMLYTRLDGDLNAHLWTGLTGNSNQSGGFVNDGNWHHVVLTGDPSGQEVYLDNALVGTGGGYLLLQNMIYNHIGNGVTSGWPSSDPVSPFSGAIDDICIFNKRLNATEVDSLFNLPAPTGTSLSENDNHVFQVYPNPTTDIITIKGDGLPISSVEILDAAGSILLQSTSPEISIQPLSAGIYYCKIQSESGIYTVPILKQ